MAGSSGFNLKGSMTAMTMKRLLVNLASTGKDRMKHLLAVLVTFVLLDGLVTEYLVGGGIAREGNPVLEPFVGGIWFLVIKASGAIICTFILWDVYRRFPRVAVGATWCFVAAYAAILAWNSSMFLA
jgi:hypothetical protein